MFFILFFYFCSFVLFFVISFFFLQKRGAPFGVNMEATFGGIGASMGGFMSSLVAPIPLSSGGFGASSGGGMCSYVFNEKVVQDREDNGGGDEA
jgi:hypothetical protein